MQYKMVYYNNIGLINPDINCFLGSYYHKNYYFDNFKKGLELQDLTKEKINHSFLFLIYISNDLYLNTRRSDII